MLRLSQSLDQKNTSSTLPQGAGSAHCPGVFTILPLFTLQPRHNFWQHFRAADRIFPGLLGRERCIAPGWEGGLDWPDRTGLI